MSTFLEVEIELTTEDEISLFFSQNVAPIENNPYHYELGEEFILELSLRTSVATHYAIAQDGYTMTLQKRRGVGVKQTVSEFLSVFCSIHPHLQNAVIWASWSENCN